MYSEFLNDDCSEMIRDFGLVHANVNVDWVHVSQVKRISSKVYFKLPISWVIKLPIC